MSDFSAAKPVLIATNKQDITVDFIVRELRRRSVPFLRLNTEDLPSATILFDQGQQIGGYIRTAAGSYDLGAFGSAYYRRPEVPIPSAHLSPEASAYALQEWSASARTIWNALEGRWLNSPFAGECIMLGAYTGYVVQLFVPNYTLSIVLALPLAFAVTFAAGVAMERLVIRHLYKRPLETLLATFGISIALQQIAKNIFGTQARPLTAPGWLDGALVLNDVVSISYIRIAIFVLAMLFLGFFLWLMKRTRLGLEVRAVTQNPGMAASMGINPDRINMLTFGIGSGIAGIAGVAIGLFAKVTSELGSDYIVQSFMTVVVGGVGNIWGTLAGAFLIGTLQKGIETGSLDTMICMQGKTQDVRH